MDTPKTCRAADWREFRRLRAVELYAEGWTQQEIADAVGVTQGAVSQWLKAHRTGGPAALRRQPRRPPTKLSAEDRALVPGLLALGAEAFGYAGDLWSCPRVADVIERCFGVRYHPAHVSKLLHALGWSPQQPQRVAAQRDEAAIAHWRRAVWPALKRGPAANAARSSS